MSTAAAFLILLGGGVLVFLYKLANTALRDRRNLRAGARLGPWSFFLEVNDQKETNQPQTPEK
jgi:hypothetical protein